ncbi:hypothetical protein H312_01608 [Anncaliia algerae PRA339]|uniref:Uncharacterized protein n=1 Tax=Anncaliia algerae PRA339 TaxID=1288291 RepID=A0A059F0Y8_9MICR|nr:hypothetical protein H312_01608 [Anncaliia algerae PRA339]
MNPNEFEEFLIKKPFNETMQYLMQKGILKKEMKCDSCLNYMSLHKYKKNRDKIAWRCCTKSCNKFKEYFSIRKNSFFEGFNCEIVFVLRVLIKYLSRQQSFSIIQYFQRDEGIIHKIIKKFKNIIPELNFEQNKLGGPGVIVQIDETMLNYKCKSHRAALQKIKQTQYLLLNTPTE